jgi:glutamate--cysteine ligase
MTDRLLHAGDIRKLFHKEPEAYDPKIGIEVEKIGLYYEKSSPPTYGGRRGYLAVLGALYEQLGWEIVQQKGKQITSMKRGGAYLHLESDGRIELAGSPHDSIHDLAREMRIHQNEIAEISKMFGIIWIGCGYHPFVKSADIQSIRSDRKRIILDYFKASKKTSGNDYGVAWEMKASGIHVNLDYKDEEDFALKNRVFTRLSPIITAMFANSPFSKRKFSGYMSFRSHVAHNNALPQFDIPQDLYESEYGFDSWIDHLGSLPLLMIHRDDNWLQPNCTFSEFLKKGFDGHSPCMEDFEFHMKSAWKDIKSKSVIELRFLDSLPPNLVPSAAALIKGLAYDQGNLRLLDEMTKVWSYENFMNLRHDVAKYGLQATFDGEPILDLAKKLIEMSKSGLKSNRIRDIENNDESLYLQDIEDFVFIKEKSPAEWLVENWMGKWRKSFYPVLDWLQY